MKTPHLIGLRRFGNDLYSRAKQDADVSVGLVLFTDPATGQQGVLHNIAGDRKLAAAALWQLANEVAKGEGLIPSPDVAPATEAPPVK